MCVRAPGAGVAVVRAMKTNRSEVGGALALTAWVQPLIESGSRLLSKLLHSSKYEVVLFCPRMTEGKQRLARQHVVQWRAHE